MLRLLSDEDFNGHVVAGLRRSYPEIDLVRAQDVGLSGNEDPDILAWAAEQGRIVLTNDKRTMLAFATQRVAGDCQCLACSSCGRVARPESSKGASVSAN